MIDHTGIIRIPVCTDRSLLETDQEEFWKELRLVLSSGLVSEAKAVVLQQKGELSDCRASWLAELLHNEVRCHVERRLRYCRNVLSSISHSETPWIFIGESDCYGTALELALATKYKLWLNQTARVGFPEIAGGVFPPLGMFQGLVQKQPGDILAWQTKPVDTVSVLQQSLGIDCVLPSDFAKGGAADFLANLVETASNKGAQQEEYVAFKKVARAAKQKEIRFDDAASSWDTITRGVRQISKPDQVDQLSRLDSAVVSSVGNDFFSRRYIYWLYQMASPTGNQTRGTQLVPPCAISVNLDYVIPPISSFKNYLTMGTPIVFRCFDELGLSSKLDLLHGWLGRFDPGLQKWWEQRVTWFVGKNAPLGLPELTWAADNTVSCSWGENSFKVLRVSGNHSNSREGIIEYVAKDFDCEGGQEAFALLARSAGRAVISKPGRSGSTGSMAVLIRSLFLEEFLAFARVNEIKSIRSVIEALKSGGWQMSGSEIIWNRGGLASRALGKPIVFHSGYLRKGFELETWGLEQISQVTNLLNPTEPRQRMISASAPFTNYHFSILAALLVLVLFVEGCTDTLIDAETIVHESLGFPRYFGSPLLFLGRLPKSQAKAFLQRLHIIDASASEVLDHYRGEVSMDFLGHIGK